MGYCFVSEIWLTPQMTGTKHEDGPTLRVQPYRTAAVVGYIMYMRVASPRSAEASCFRLHEGTTFYRTTIKTIPSVILLDCKKHTAVDTGADGTTLTSYRPAGVQPPCTKRATLCACGCCCRSGSLIGACHLSPHNTPYFRCASTSCASPLHVHRSRKFGR